MGLLPGIVPVKAAFSAVSALVRAARPGRGDFAGQLRESVEARFMAHFDADKNGTVTPDEFPGEPASFRRWDRNGDGGVTSAEARLEMTLISDAARARKAAQESWDLHDADRDGRLTRAEAGLTKKELSALDTDADGTLGTREWFAARGLKEGQ